MTATLKRKGAAAQAMAAAPAPLRCEQRSVKGFTGTGLAVGAPGLCNRQSRAPCRHAGPTRPSAYTGTIHRQSTAAQQPAAAGHGPSSRAPSVVPVPVTAPTLPIAAAPFGLL
jgi:hypothetical protein